MKKYFEIEFPEEELENYKSDVLQGVLCDWAGCTLECPIKVKEIPVSRIKEEPKPVSTEEFVNLDEDLLRRNFDTHDWDWGQELPVCKRCRKNPIGMGFWGDKNWRLTHLQWKKQCEGLV